jgi:hypothetical protein
MDPDTIDRVGAKVRGRPRARSRLIGTLDARNLTITALENGAQLEDVQKAAGHPDRGTTKLYDRRDYNPEKAESLFALSGLTAARLRARRFDFVASPEPPMLVAHHTIFWEIRA